MRYIKAGILVLASLIWGCAGSGKIEKRTYTTHIAEANQPENYTLVYSLPRTTLKLNVSATEVITRRGPYYQYAEKYLGISDVPGQNVTRWRMDSVEIDSYQESDPEHYYSLITNDRYVTNFFTLKEEGYIIPFNCRQMPEMETFVQIRTGEPEKPLFTDLSVHPNVVEETRTVMRMVRQDTAFVNIPVMQRQSVTKSTEAKAAEAADLIFELRSNRFKLISGDLDLFPDGRAMKTILEEFARLEQEYITLFTGKVFEIKHDYLFEFTPDKPASESGTEYQILFRFSDSAGVLPASDVSGRPISLEIINEMKTVPLERISRLPASPGESPNHLFYRIPDAAQVKLTDGNRSIASKRMLLSQYGRIVSLPANFLWY